MRGKKGKRGKRGRSDVDDDNNEDLIQSIYLPLPSQYQHPLPSQYQSHQQLPHFRPQFLFPYQPQLALPPPDPQPELDPPQLDPPPLRKSLLAKIMLYGMYGCVSALFVYQFYELASNGGFTINAVTKLLTFCTLLVFILTIINSILTSLNN